MTTATDNFNRADGGLGANWQMLGAGSFSITSNVVTGSEQCRYIGASFGNNQRASVKIVAVAEFSYPAVCVRVGAAPSGYAAIVESSASSPAPGWRLAKIESTAANTDLLTGPDTIANGDTIEIRASGTTISIWKNGVQLGSITDSTYSSGAPGLWNYASGATVDDFSATDDAADAAPSMLSLLGCG